MYKVELGRGPLGTLVLGYSPRKAGERGSVHYVRLYSTLELWVPPSDIGVVGASPSTFPPSARGDIFLRTPPAVPSGSVLL